MRVSSGNVLIITLIFMLVATMVVELAASNPSTLTETVIKVEPALIEFGNPAGDPIPIPGTQFTVTIKIYNVTNLYGFDLKFRWNTTFLQYVNHSVYVPIDTYADGILWNPILSLADEVNTTEGTYEIAYASMNPAPSFNGTGTVFTMTFEILKQPYYETGGPSVDPIDTLLDFSSTDLAPRTPPDPIVPIMHNVEPATVRIWESAHDVTPPAIDTPTQNPPTTNVQPGQSVTVSVNITDAESGVRNATLLYTNDTTWYSVPIVLNTSSGLWKGIIPGHLYNTQVKYRIIAYDNAENYAENDNAGSYFIYTVIPEFTPIMILLLVALSTATAVFLGRKLKG